MRISSRAKALNELLGWDSDSLAKQMLCTSTVPRVPPVVQQYDCRQVHGRIYHISCKGAPLWARLSDRGRCLGKVGENMVSSPMKKNNLRHQVQLVRLQCVSHNLQNKGNVMNKLIRACWPNLPMLASYNTGWGRVGCRCAGRWWWSGGRPRARSAYTVVDAAVS